MGDKRRAVQPYPIETSMFRSIIRDRTKDNFPRGVSLVVLIDVKRESLHRWNTFPGLVNHLPDSRKRPWKYSVMGQLVQSSVDKFLRTKMGEIGPDLEVFWSRSW